MMQKVMLTTYRIWASIGKTPHFENKKRLVRRKELRQQKELDQEDTGSKP